MNGYEWLGWVFLYSVGAVAWLIILGLIAEDAHDRNKQWVCRTYATAAAFWLVWPLALVGLVLYSVGYFAQWATRNMWALRNAGTS